ncbi:MAG: hypothetical protein AAF394_08305 [Planctomycetota bacterium]
MSHCSVNLGRKGKLRLYIFMRELPTTQRDIAENLPTGHDESTTFDTQPVSRPSEGYAHLDSR